MPVLKNVDFHLLVCLDVLVAECNVTQAADRLEMSQGNMSNTLSRLRQLFGDPILIRTSRGMMATERARELQLGAQGIIHHVKALLQSPEDRDLSTTAGVIKLACADATALFILGPLLEELRTKAPKLSIEITQILSSRVKEPLEAGTVDLAVGAYLDLAENLHVTRLIGGKMVCAMSASNPLAAEGLDMEGFASAPHAILTAGYGAIATVETITDQILTTHGRKRAVHLRSQYVTVIADAVSRSDLIATMPDFMLRHFAKTLPLVGVDPPLDLPGFSLAVVWHPRQNGDWVLRWFRQCLRKHLRSAQLKHDDDAAAPACERRTAFPTRLACDRTLLVQ